MNRPILFLDIDGVLNNHRILKKAGCCGIDRRCIVNLNRILEKTDCQIVLSTAWRYMVHCGSMTMDGFWHMLRTHGMTNLGKGNPIIGLTRKDDVELYKKPKRMERERAIQVREWLLAYMRRNDKEKRLSRLDTRYCVLDDCDLGFSHYKLPFVQTEGSVGLTLADANKVIAMLGEIQ